MKRASLLLPLPVFLTACAPDGSGITWQDVWFVGVICAAFVACCWIFFWAMSRD